MFDTFGKLNYEDLLKTAAGLKAEGDLENIKVLGEENGISEFEIKVYIEGQSAELTDTFGAAVGKLNVEKKEKFGSYVPITPVVDYLCNMSLEEEFAKKIRNTEKSLKECAQTIEGKAKEMVRKTNENYIADATVYKWAKEYYMEG